MTKTIIAALAVFFLTSPGFAAKNACITRDACVTRGISHGWTSSQAGRWCDRNRISEACYK